MSDSLARCVQRHLEGLVVGPPAYDPRGELANLVVYPLFPATLSPDPPGVISLSEGLRRGVRLNDTGLVDRVHIDNPLPASVLVGESEILVGATQARSLQFSCLVPPHRRASLPVSCVEEGQPTQFQAPFEQTAACPWFLRSFKMDLLARHGQMHQHRIWSKVREYLHTAQAPSDTGAVQAVFAHNGRWLEGLEPLFPPRPGQVGAVCAVGHELFVELFADPELLEDGYGRLLRSGLIEAVVHPGVEVVPGDRVPEFLDQLVEVSRHSRVVQSRSLKGQGRSLVFSSHGVSGSALVAGDGLVHLCAHKRCWGLGQPLAAQRGQLDASCSAWQNERAEYLDRLERDYAGRRRRYLDYVSRLVPSPVAEPIARPRPAADPAAPPARPAARPLPLSRNLHRLFLRLFDRAP